MEWLARSWRVAASSIDYNLECSAHPAVNGDVFTVVRHRTGRAGRAERQYATHVDDEIAPLDDGFVLEADVGRVCVPPEQGFYLRTSTDDRHARKQELGVIGVQANDAIHILVSKRLGKDLSN